MAASYALKVFFSHKEAQKPKCAEPNLSFLCLSVVNFGQRNSYAKAVDNDCKSARLTKSQYALRASF
jgi:hypothetical protein